MTADISLSDKLSIRGGLIAPPGPARLHIDVSGLDIIPGLIDVHGDAFERAVAPRPGVNLPVGIALAELDSQLLAAGVTTAYLAITLSWEAGLRSAETYRLLRDALLARPKNAVPELKFHVRFEAHNLDALDMLLADIEAGHVDMLSFNDHTPSILRKLPNPVAVSKMAERAGQSYEQFKADAERAGASKPEDILAGRARLAEAARKRNIPMASHDDTSIENRDEFRALGAAISEFPTNVEVAQYAIANGEMTVMGAPNVVRGGSHTGWHGAEDLVRMGACSVLCSDYHYPSLLQSIYIIARNNSAPFEDAVNLVTKNAALMARLEDRGTLEYGTRADILLVAPDPLPRLVAVIANGKLAYIAPDAMARVSENAVISA